MKGLVQLSQGAMPRFVPRRLGQLVLSTNDRDANGCSCLVVLLVLQVQWNTAEVSEVQYIELPDLQAQMGAEPDKFTEWFRQEIQMLAFFIDPSSN
jgi:isopentenyldiphosphate isomerase